MLSEDEKQAIKECKRLSKEDYYGDSYFAEKHSIQILLNLIEKLQKEITRLQNKLLDKIEGTKIIKEETTEYIKENYISKDKIRKLIKEKQDKINKLHSASDCVIIDDLENQISILQELLESSDKNE